MKFFKRVKKFLSTAFIGGFGVIFPALILFFLFSWLFRIVSNALRPIAVQINQWIGISVGMASILAVLAILGTCFFIGLVVRTRTGHFIHKMLEKHFLSRVPGYRLLREAAKPFFNTERNVAFTKPALIRPYETDTLMTAFITDYHEESGMYTAFVPTSPNPTNGLLFHVSKDRVQFLDSTFEETMRSVVAGGNGSKALLSKIQNGQNSAP